LYGISGRGRKAQIALAEQFGITDYPQPSGGCCYLIHQPYSRRLRDFLDHEEAGDLTGEWVRLLAVGRHLRLASGRRVIIGRREEENVYLQTCGLVGALLTTVDHPGPTTLLPGKPSRGEIQLGAQVTAGYSDGSEEPVVRVEVRYVGQAQQEPVVLGVKPMAKQDARLFMV